MLAVAIGGTAASVGGASVPLARLGESASRVAGETGTGLITSAGGATANALRRALLEGACVSTPDTCGTPAEGAREGPDGGAGLAGSIGSVGVTTLSPEGVARTPRLESSTTIEFGVAGSMRRKTSATATAPIPIEGMIQRTGAGLKHQRWRGCPVAYQLSGGCVGRDLTLRCASSGRYRIDYRRIDLLPWRSRN